MTNACKDLETFLTPRFFQIYIYICKKREIVHELIATQFSSPPFVFQGNRPAFLSSILTPDNIPAIVQGKFRVQRMSKLFAKHWAFTLALQQFVFHFRLIFISIDKAKLIHQCQGLFR